MRRNAARGVRAVCFSELPYHLGLPTIHSGYWDPFFAACADTGTVVAMHIGSSSKMPAASPDAPPSVSATLAFGNAMSSLVDFLMSGVLVRYPELKLLYAESQIGWIPYALQRVDQVWEDNQGWAQTKHIPEPPSTYYYRSVYGCFINDPHGLDVARRGRRRQRHLRDRLPAQRLELARHQGDRDASCWPARPTTCPQIVRGNAIKLLDLPFA